MSAIEVQLKKIDTEPDIEKAGIAIIDDDLSFSLMLKEYLLSNAQVNSDLFPNGEDFLKEYQSNDDRKIILDYNFGQGLDGLTILQKIK